MAGCANSVSVVPELPRQQDFLPVALARKHVLVRRPHRPELEEGEAQVCPGVLGALSADQFRFWSASRQQKYTARLDLGR